MKTKLPRRLPCKYCNRIVGTMRIGDHRYIELHGRQYGFTTPTKCPGSGQKVAERKMKKKKLGKYIFLLEEAIAARNIERDKYLNRQKRTVGMDQMRELNQKESPCQRCGIVKQDSYDLCDDCQDLLEAQSNGDDADFQPCDECDLPDACADFGCAIKSGVRK